MPLIIDASVAIKFVVEEPGAAAALALLDRAERRFAPDWMVAEAASALANKVRFQGLGGPHAARALELLPSFLDELMPSLPLLAATIRLSADLNHATYDCLYLALAQTCDGTVVTADEGFVNAATRAGLGRQVERLTWA